MADPVRQAQADEQALMKYYQGLVAKAKPGQPVKIIPSEYWKYLIGEDAYQQQLTRARKFNPNIDKQMNTPVHMGIVPEEAFNTGSSGAVPKTEGIRTYVPGKPERVPGAYTVSTGVATDKEGKVIPASFNVSGRIKNPEFNMAQHATTARAILPHEIRHIMDQLRFTQEKNAQGYADRAQRGLWGAPTAGNKHTEYRAYAGDIITEANRLRRLSGLQPIDPGGAEDPVQATLDLIKDYETRRASLGGRANLGGDNTLSGQIQHTIGPMREYLLQLQGKASNPARMQMKLEGTTPKDIQQARQRFIDDLRKSISGMDRYDSGVSIQNGRFAVDGVV